MLIVNNTTVLHLSNILIIRSFIPQSPNKKEIMEQRSVVGYCFETKDYFEIAYNSLK